MKMVPDKCLHDFDIIGLFSGNTREEVISLLKTELPENAVFEAFDTYEGVCISVYSTRPETKEEKQTRLVEEKRQEEIKARRKEAAKRAAVTRRANREAKEMAELERLQTKYYASM